MQLPRRETTLAVIVVAAAAGLFAVGIWADQIGETLFNATLV